jgi:hypothetical protein
MQYSWDKRIVAILYVSKESDIACHGMMFHAGNIK